MRLAKILSQSPGQGAKPASIYLHIPFCSSKCGYCDFHSRPLDSVAPSLRAAYVEKLLSRLGECVDELDAPLETLYIGGGTPTALEDDLLERLLTGAGAIVGRDLREWTLEANPESLSPEKLVVAASAGVTRLSLGIQSMDGAELRILGRKASPEDNVRAVHLAVASRLAVSADLISSIPQPAGAERRSDRSSLADSLTFLLDEGVGHLSIYDLVVEEGTPISARLKKGELVLPDADVAWAERKEAELQLCEKGYSRYEVSNFAPPGAESLHNAVYWSMRSYLGIGSGAVSTLVSEGTVFDLEDPGTASLRMEEGRDLEAWLKDPDACLSVSRITKKDSAFESIMMGLRTAAGLDLERFRLRFSADPEAILARTLGIWKNKFRNKEGRLAVDDAGLDLLNPILVDALIDIENYFGEDHGSKR